VESKAGTAGSQVESQRPEGAHPRVGNGERVFVEMQKLGVIVRPVTGYGLREWVRISIGTPAENIRCLEGLKQVLRAIPA